MKTRCVVALTLLLIVVVAGCGREARPAPVAEVDLSPESWPDGELEKYGALSAFQGEKSIGAQSETGMVSGTMAAPAVQAGLEALNQGGTAADAALVTALAQIALQPGNFVTPAGILTMVYYDAENEEVVSLNAAYNVPAAETDAGSIPTLESNQPSGRTTLVPGFMAGVQAAHDRYGVLPFEALFEPAIYFAEEGFILDPFQANTIQSFSPVLSRRPETAAIFQRPDGWFYGSGDVFRQEALAGTLRAVAEQGAGYMYTGPWAEKFVAAVQSEGGKITLEDMANYQVIWSEPVHTGYGEVEIYAPGLPAFGGVNAVEAFNLVEAAGLADMGEYGSSAEALFWLMQISRVGALSYQSFEALRAQFPGQDLSLEGRQSKETAQWLWGQLEAGSFPYTTSPGDHSAAVLAVDQWGNAAALVHSINALFWGQTGIFVDGVSVPDSAAHQVDLVVQAGPGNRLPDPTNPMIILRDGKLLVVSAAIGDIHRESLARLFNVLDYGLNPREALEAPTLLMPDVRGNEIVEKVVEGEYGTAVVAGVREMGQPLEEVNLTFGETILSRGLWVGIRIDSKEGLQGGAPGLLGGYVLGQ